MAFITFITPYRPIICGIADYAYFITRENTPDTCDVLSFDLANYGVSLHGDLSSHPCRVWYGIHSRSDFSRSSILEGLRPHKDQVLWFQHEFGIWTDSARFVDMLMDLAQIKVVSVHSLHFQNNETKYGLRKHEHAFLRTLLPYVDAITVFSDGAYRAVNQAFPEYVDKVYVLRHGIHVYHEVASMTRQEAKFKMYEYLSKDPRLDEASKRHLKQQQVLLDPDTIVIGGTGFITGSKGIELIYQARDILQQMLPEAKIAALYVGHLREPDREIDSNCAVELRKRCNGKGKVLLETYLPEDMFPIMLRALDIHFYWPSDCTQSGILAHSLGTGATIVCRDMEGVGETVKMAGGLSCMRIEQAFISLKELVLHPEVRKEMSEKAVRYAEEFSWRNQSLKHFELVERLCRSRIQRLVPAFPIVPYVDAAGKPSLTVTGNKSTINKVGATG